MNVADWIILFILLFAVAAAAPFPSMVVIFGKEKEHEETEHAGSRGTGKEEA